MKLPHAMVVVALSASLIFSPAAGLPAQRNCLAPKSNLDKALDAARRAAAMGIHTGAEEEPQKISNPSEVFALYQIKNGRTEQNGNAKLDVPRMEALKRLSAGMILLRKQYPWLKLFNGPLTVKVLKGPLEKPAYWEREGVLVLALNILQAKYPQMPDARATKEENALFVAREARWLSPLLHEGLRASQPFRILAQESFPDSSPNPSSAITDAAVEIYAGYAEQGVIPPQGDNTRLMVGWRRMIRRMDDLALISADETARVVGSMSHYLNNALQMVTGFAELFQSTPADSREEIQFARQKMFLGLGEFLKRFYRLKSLHNVYVVATTVGQRVYEIVPKTREDFDESHLLAAQKDWDEKHPEETALRQYVKRQWVEDFQAEVDALRVFAGQRASLESLLSDASQRPEVERSVRKTFAENLTAKASTLIKKIKREAAWSKLMIEAAADKKLAYAWRLELRFWSLPASQEVAEKSL